MKEIFRLALRNLSEHKSKTIIISLFLVFGMAIVVLGNSFLESINRGLEKDFRQNYTGDLVISIQPEKGTILDIFGVVFCVIGAFLIKNIETDILHYIFAGFLIILALIEFYKIIFKKWHFI